MKSRIILVFLFFFLSRLPVKAQSDLQFSQYMFNLLYVNPGYAGYKEQINSTAFFRAQYLGFSGAPLTSSISIDAPVFSDNMGFGLQVNSDKIGIQNNLTANIAYSYRLALGDDARLCFGVQGGISQFSQNTNGVNPSQTGDGTITNGNINSLNATSRFGLFYYNSLFYIGLSASNLYTKPLGNTKVGILYPIPVKNYYITAGALIPINDNISLKPSFLVKSPENGITTADINCFVLLSNRLWLGASYRTGVPFPQGQITKSTTSSSNSYLFLAEFYINEKFRVGYAYDYPVGNLLTAASGNHEFSIGYFIPISRTNFKNSMVTPRYF